MTKVTFIGQEPTKESKHIELVKYYQSPNYVNEIAEGWKFCDLAARNVKDGLDLILCYDFNNSVGVISYLGHWNDGTTSNPETVCTVLGEDVPVKKGKGIEFVKCLHSSFKTAQLAESALLPNEFKNIEVIRSKADGSYDIFFAYGNERHLGGIYLGYLNDGFVE
jgi:hypothetical protein